MKLFKFGSCFLIFVFICIGCSPKSVDIKTTIQQYIENKGYEFIKFDKEFEPYVLTEKLLNEDMFERNMWEVQQEEAEKFIGKTIKKYRVIVRNHPLEEKYRTEETFVKLIVVDDEIVGGTSFPKTEETLYGGPYSLEGKTFDEVKEEKKSN